MGEVVEVDLLVIGRANTMIRSISGVRVIAAPTINDIRGMGILADAAVTYRSELRPHFSILQDTEISLLSSGVETGIVFVLTDFWERLGNQMVSDGKRKAVFYPPDWLYPALQTATIANFVAAYMQGGTEAPSP